MPGDAEMTASNVITSTCRAPLHHGQPAAGMIEMHVLAEHNPAGQPAGI
jgi:hypothetical protein